MHEEILRARAITDRLFAQVLPEALYERPISERHRLIFYVGHLEAFDWNLIGKSFLLVFAMIWFRWTFPRVRQDQLQALAWKWLVPISLANVILTGIFKVVL